jgi:hypothetical protein
LVSCDYLLSPNHAFISRPTWTDPAVILPTLSIVAPDTADVKPEAGLLGISASKLVDTGPEITYIEHLDMVFEA